ncbi:MAG TPA: hypothetical protein VEB86_05400, partial [Chryseosolibacter sp.]|nr:hypothetical protein [Chryseosolibacter sp.]
MKKILLTVAGSLLIALAAVNAQERSDTTRTDQPSSEYRTESGTQGETQTLEGRSGTQGQSWRDEDRLSITRDELPQDLLKTLESDQYRGWENATIYRHKTSEDYMLVIQDNGEVRTFYFDKQGRAMDDTKLPEDNDMDLNQQQSSDQQDPSTQDQQMSGDTQYQHNDIDQSASQDPQWRSEDKILISTSKLPSAMLITLGDPKYVGWEKSKVYRNKSTNEYMIEINDGTTTRAYYFDQSGNAKTAMGTTSDQYRSETMGPVQTDQPSIQWRTEDRVVVTAGEVPSGLRLTLSGDDRYKGWENSTIYRNRTTNDYMVEIRDGSTTNTYYFDSEGKTRTYGTGEDNDQYRKDDEDNEDPLDDSDGGRSGYSSTEEKIPTGAKTKGTSGVYEEWAPQDKVMITVSEVPPMLRATLSDEQYKGWEKSTIYRNRTTNEFLVEIRDGSEVKTYYFDKNGKAMV